MNYFSAVLMLFCCVIAGLFSSANIAVAQTQFQSLNYLYEIRGSKTIGGIHNREPNSDPNKQTRAIYETTEKWPGLYSADFLFSEDDIANRQKIADQAIVEWRNGAVVNVMWHACNPAKQQPCWFDSNGVTSYMSDAEWNQLITNDTALNKNWKRMMDEIAIYLQQLENAGVEVLFRPLHEMNQGAFWWGGRRGANGTARLYQITHDYLVQQKGLSNLIWVWDLQDFSTLQYDVNDYDPGSNYWDVLALDMYYSDGQGYTQAKYNVIANKAAGKPIAIGEFEVLPSVAELNAQPLWTFFMGWAELVFQRNSTQKIQEIYGSDRVLTLNEMPRWNRPLSPSSRSSSSTQSSRSNSKLYIQAENYSNMSGVQTENTTDSSGGTNVGWIDAGDWMSFSNISIPHSGTYSIAFRVASPLVGGKLQFEQAGGGVIYGNITIPNTGGWQTWTTVYLNVTLTAGTQDFGIKALTEGWNINWWSITPIQ
jgi:Glycosyl hydrolase family 26/Carbohydrate binding module (family 6)